MAGLCFDTKHEQPNIFKFQYKMTHHFPHCFKAHFGKCVKIRIKIVEKLTEDKKSHQLHDHRWGERIRKKMHELHGCYHNQNLFITLL